MAKKNARTFDSCPCGSGKSLTDCCARWFVAHNAPDAESLMRSRYTAYSLGMVDYLLATWHESKCPNNLELEEDMRWIGLKIVDCQAGKPGDDSGVVQFVARYKATNGRAGRMEERSRFVFEQGRWFYLDAED